MIARHFNPFFRRSARPVAMIALVLSAALVATAGALAEQDGHSVRQQAYLGLGVAPVPEPLMAHLREVVGDGRGVLVAQVMEGSPAERAGLRIYDVVIRYDDQAVFSPEQLVKLVRNDKPGREVTLHVVRGGKIHPIKATLGAVAVRAPVRGRLAERLPRLRDLLTPGEPKRSTERRPPAAQPERRAEAAKTPWKTFESMTVAKLDEKHYKVEINYIDGDKKQVHREYVGTRDEIKKAINADADLPPDERAHLLRTLDMQERPPILILPDLDLIERELFNWPNLDF